MQFQALREEPNKNPQWSESIPLGDFSYGATESAVIVLQANSRRALSRLVQDRNWHRSGDNPGQIYAGSCQLIRAIKDDNGKWMGICISSVHRDV